MKEIEWSEESLDDMAALDKGTAKRIKKAVERFAETGAGNIRKLQGINPPEFRLRAGSFRVASTATPTLLPSSAFWIAKKLTAEPARHGAYIVGLSILDSLVCRWL